MVTTAKSETGWKPNYKLLCRSVTAKKIKQEAANAREMREMEHEEQERRRREREERRGRGESREQGSPELEADPEREHVDERKRKDKEQETARRAKEAELERRQNAEVTRLGNEIQELEGALEVSARAFNDGVFTAREEREAKAYLLSVQPDDEARVLEFPEDEKVTWNKILRKILITCVRSNANEVENVVIEICAAKLEKVDRGQCNDLLQLHISCKRQ